MPVFPASIVSEHADKPRRGEPCNNCGLCCRVDTCQVSRQLLQSEQTPCIALEMHDGKFMCGMLRRPEHYLPNGKVTPEDLHFILYWVHPGFGCEMPDEIKLVQIR